MTRKKSTEWVVKNNLTAQNGDLEILSALLQERGINEEEKESFINPQLGDITVDKLYDSRTAAKNILKAIENNKKIFIHGDFDADGICATTLLWEFLYRTVSKKVGREIDVLPFIPSRADDGYGLSEGSVEQLSELGAEMIITVDCGIRDTALIENYTDIEFVITDHHQPGDGFEPDDSYTLVHPMYPDKEYLQTSISGTFVAFLVVQAIKRELNILEELNEDTEGLDLVALSTVTDIMPLTDLNRVVVHYGLRQIRNGTRVGLAMLMQIAGVTPSNLNSYHLGFVLGPRINAVGRIGDPMDGVRLLSSKSKDKARELSNKINKVNSDRQKITQEIMLEAEDQVDEDSDIILVKGEDWPEGIVGLVAGKLLEKYQKPTLVMSEKEEIRGSARSLGGFNITKALESVSENLLKFGGHAEAAGFTLENDKFEKFSKALVKVASKELEGVDLKRSRKIDAQISLEMINIPLILEIQKLEPYGHKNNKPLFLIEDLEIRKKKIMGSNKNHLKITVTDDSKKFVDAVMFDCEEDIPHLNIGEQIKLVGYLDVNEWNGSVSIQLQVSEWENMS